MIFHRIPVTDLETNCYILSREGSGALVIDAGGDAERIIEWLQENKLVPEWIVCTHGHADHLEGNSLLRKTYPLVKIAISTTDAPCLTSAIRNMSVLMGYWVKSPAADLKLNDRDKFVFQDLSFEVIAVPGHTAGGICLFARLPEDEEHPILFSGDVLFSRAIGRSDIPGGNHEILVKTIRERLLTLPGGTKVYPGHGPATTIASEARYNTWLRDSAS